MKEKKCDHEWVFLERWFSDDITEYVFYCTHYLEVTNQQINMVNKKRNKK